MYKIINPESDVQLQNYYKLRWILLRRPLGGKRGTEIDDLESSSIHRAIVNDMDLMIGVGRMHFVNQAAQLRYMGIKKAYWRKGLGSRLITEFESIAIKNNINIIFLNSRANAIDFYKNNGYTLKKQVKPSFGSICHYRMEKILEK